LGVAVVSSVTDAQTRREQGEEALCGKGKNGGRKGGGGDGADPFIPMWQGGSGGGGKGYPCGGKEDSGGGWLSVRAMIAGW
jgi:hypothetical protein